MSELTDNDDITANFSNIFKTRKIRIKHPRLKQELLQFLQANNYFSLDPNQAEQVVDIYIKTYKNQ